MNVLKKLKSRIPLIVTVFCCFVVGAVSATVKASENAQTASVNSSPKQVIVLDAGHGGMDSGCVAVNGVYEKDINLNIVKYLGELLSFSGYEVIYTRTEDVSIHDNGVEGIRNQKVSDMENRLEIVKKYPDSIFFSVHQNQYTSDEYFGGQMFYTTNNSGNFRLATIMQSKFAELQTGNDREIKLIDNGLYLFKETAQPSLLIECGFLSNESDAKNLSNSEYQKKVAFTIYKGLSEYLGEVNTKESEIIGETEGVLHMQ